VSGGAADVDAAPSFLACDDALVGVAFALAVALVLFVIDVVLL
jgi:hypothetical protein